MYTYTGIHVPIPTHPTKGFFRELALGLESAGKKHKDKFGSEPDTLIISREAPKAIQSLFRKRYRKIVTSPIPVGDFGVTSGRES